MPQTISLLNMKGGVGKTTLAVNLAWYMHLEKSKNVLLVDLDPQFNATQYVMDFEAFEEHRKKRGTVADLLIDVPNLSLTKKKLKTNPKTAIYNVHNKGSKRFDLLPAELSLAWVVKNPAQMDFCLNNLLSEIGKAYDFIFIDCAPTDSVLTTMALTSSEFLLVPMRPDRFSLLGYLNLLQTLQTFRKKCPDPHKVKDLGVVFTQVTETSSIESSCMAAVRTEARKVGGYVFGSFFKYSQSFQRAVSDQTPIFNTKHAAPTTKALTEQVADEMQRRIDALSKIVTA